MDWSKISVLVVEDSRTQALLLTKVLEEKKVSVTHSQNGKQALEHLSTTMPSIIISDINMPEMDGIELCKKIRSDAKFADVPIILYTALYNTEEVFSGVNAGANYFLTKPCAPEVILSIIEDSLSGKQKSSTPQHIEIAYRGQQYTFDIDPVRMVTLLLSTYGSAVEKNRNIELARQELKEKNVELQILNEQKNAFLGMAAHDLRNPISIIREYANLLHSSLEGKIEPELLEMVQSISSSTERMLLIVNELLDTSVIESGNLKLEKKPTNLKELFEKNVKLSSQISKQKNIRLSLDVAPGIVEVECDGKKIEQVLANFVTNAIKYSQPDTDVNIKLYPENESIHFLVQDHGQGIPKEEQNKLFKNYSKTSVKPTAGESSTGLGLAIVRKIVEAHGGSVWLDSEEGKGSTFHVTLPHKGKAA